MLHLDSTTLHDFASATQYEWLETNGLGGWSGSTAIHAHTRRYHGLLVAAIHPPADRMVLVSKLDETIVTANGSFPLGSNLYDEAVISPTGNQYLQFFSKGIFPQWEYEADGIGLKKTIAMEHEENTTLVIYDVVHAPEPFRLELEPFIAARGYHSIGQAGPQMHWDVQFENHVLHHQPDGQQDIFIKVPGAEYSHEPGWYYHINYSEERDRGLEFREDLFRPGKCSVVLKQGDSLGIIISTHNPESCDAHELLARENLRRQLLLREEPADELVQALVLAADQFIVKRDEDLKTVIAGYHWFADWARDTMISLPGLTLLTRRFEDAKKILSAFARNVSMGMLPNRFLTHAEPAEYNHVDGTLWFFIAVHKYLQYTGDREFVFNEMLPVLKEIIDWHFRGARYNIHVDSDGLLYAGEAGQQLTWMDAKAGDWVVTPRMGKPVEVQALWYNALKIFSQLLDWNGQKTDASEVEISAERMRDSFDKLFWYEDGQYLYDLIDENGNPDPALRPNQLLAMSLPFRLITGEKARSVLHRVESELYCEMGLRSLTASDTRYIPVYTGDPVHRDAAYHQGSVWSWLLGPYVDAVIHVRGVEGLDQARQIIRAFSPHLNEACIGSVSEIFDGDPPHRPRGCIAQAWGVAEILRVIKEYGIYHTGADQAIREKGIEEPKALT